MLLLAIGLLAGIIIGAMVGWFAKDLRTHLRMLIHDSRTKKPEAPVQRPSASGVIVQGQVRQKGKVIDLPDAGSVPTGIVRPRTPKQVKLDGDRYIDQVIEEVKVR